MKSLAVREEQGILVGNMLAGTPAEVVPFARSIATELARVIEDRKLYTTIKGKKFVHVEAWCALGALLGVIAMEKEVRRRDDGSFEAVVELQRIADGAVVGRGSAICGTHDDRDWVNRPEFQKRSMCITRAVGKAFRLSFAWILALANYETTPAEELEEPSAKKEQVPTPQPPKAETPVRAAWREAFLKFKSLNGEDYQPTDFSRFVALSLGCTEAEVKEQPEESVRAFLRLAITLGRDVGMCTAIVERAGITFAQIREVLLRAAGGEDTPEALLPAVREMDGREVEQIKKLVEAPDENLLITDQDLPRELFD